MTYRMVGRVAASQAACAPRPVMRIDTSISLRPQIAACALR